jgi:SAM-dependent methyltransferase
LSRVVKALRQKRVPEDRDFDLFLPRELRALSDQHWSPLSVAVRTAEWIDDLGVATVLDVGAGAGKLCVAAALASHARFVGIEQRPSLVAAARELARIFGVDDRVTFLEGKLGDVELPPCDALYFYNPFGENLFGKASHIDEEVELHRARHTKDVHLAEDLLARAPAGTVVILYNGFGGTMPAAYDQIRIDREQPSVLRAWRKAGAT